MTGALPVWGGRHEAQTESSHERSGSVDCLRVREFSLQLSTGDQCPRVAGAPPVEGLGAADRRWLGEVRQAGRGSEGEGARSAGDFSQAGL